MIMPELHQKRHDKTRRHQINLEHYSKTSYYEYQNDTHNRIIDQGEEIGPPMESVVCILCTELFLDVKSLRSHQAQVCHYEAIKYYEFGLNR